MTSQRELVDGLLEGDLGTLDLLCYQIYCYDNFAM